MQLSSDMITQLRIPYALRRIPYSRFASRLPVPESVQAGDVALCRLEKIGKNAGLELTTGRRSIVHEGDLLAVVFGNRYATKQFEGYARANGDRCDLLSMGGLCGLVESKHAGVTEPSKLRLLGAIGDAQGQPLRLRDFALKPVAKVRRPRVIAVVGTSMDAGKTYTVMSLIRGLRRQGHRVAGIKLTGTAAGKDTWSMADAGACVALDFGDGGYPSTYMSSTSELLDLHELLLSNAAMYDAGWAVVEIADGLLQRETSGLLQSARFKSGIDAWVLAAGEPMAAVAGVQQLLDYGVTPAAVSGLVSMSPLGVHEVEYATGVTCLTARELQCVQSSEELLAVLPEVAAVSNGNLAPRTLPLVWADVEV